MTPRDRKFGGAGPAGQSVKAVTAAFGVHPNYLSTLRKTAHEKGSTGLVKVQGLPVKLTGAQREQVRVRFHDQPAGRRCRGLP
jgi:hypothetical protein